jgi:hypothetical protein
MASETVRVIAMDSRGLFVSVPGVCQIKQMKYLSEDGGLDVQRGADCGTAEEREEGRGEERQEHAGISLCNIKKKPREMRKGWKERE